MNCFISLIRILKLFYVLRRGNAPPVILALLLFWSPKDACGRGLIEFGFTNDRDGVVEMLELLGDQETAADFYNEIVNKLDADDFAVREEATQKLSRMPVIDRSLLEELARTASPEAAIRIQRILKTNNLERFESMLMAVLDVIVEGDEKGLLEPLFKALETRGDYGKGDIWKRAGEAAEVTVEEKDIKFLARAIQSPSDVVRSASIQAIVAVAGEEAATMIIPVAVDASPYVMWEAARSLAVLRRRECLRPFARLLMCDEDFGMRWRSLDALRKLTGQRFNYYAAGNSEERAGPAAKWMAWIKDNEKTASLNFGSTGKKQILKVFNGKNLDGWSAFAGLEPALLQGKAVVDDGWQVKGDVLLAVAGANGGQGELRTNERFLNFELRLEYRFPDGKGDSGVGIFAGDRGEGYLEVQLHPGNSGDLYRISGQPKAGKFEMKRDDGKPLSFRAMKFKESNERNAEWNTMRIRVIDGAVEVHVNELLQNRVNGGPKTPRGIVLRRESVPPGRLEFRNMFLEKL